ncbi:MAG: CHAP domain-containing protein, partial [Clostridia bacterium]|nr:CHAP domain-containing protein [Clostridia bacterium]
AGAGAGAAGAGAAAGAAGAGAGAGAAGAGAAGAGAAGAGAAAAGTTAAAAGTTAAATGTAAAAGTAAATAGTVAAAGGAVAAQAAIPVAGWIALAIEAAILLMIGLYKMQKKFDKKMEEKGIDSKGIRRLMLISPILMPIAIIVLVVVLIALLMQAETADRTQFMIDALECFENNGGTGTTKASNKCVDFYGSNLLFSEGILAGRFGRYFGVNSKSPLIKKTDFAIAMFVAEYLGVELLVFGENGVEHSLKDSMESVSNYDFLNENKNSVLEKMKEVLTFFLDPLGILDKINDFVKEGWYLFKWCKMEKKIFNNIEWGSVTVHKVSEGPLVDLFNSTVDRIALGIIEVDPSEYLRRTYYDTTQWKTGIDFNLTTGYLRIPGTAIGNLFKCAVTLDQAIALTDEYIPSFIEIYATYAATGDYKRADKVYDYYVDNMRKGKPLELRLVTYEKFTVDKVHRWGDGPGNTPVSTIVYNQTNPDGSWDNRDIGESGFNSIKSAIQAKRKWWQKIADAVRNAVVSFINEVITAVNTLWEEVKALFGFDVTIKKEYVTVVEKGASYEYMVENYYRMGIDEYEVERPAVVEKTPSIGASKRYPASGHIELRYEVTRDVYDAEGNKIGTETIESDSWDMAIRAQGAVKYNERHTITQHTLIPKSTCKMEMFGKTPETEGSNNRYAWILNKIDEAEKAKAQRYPNATNTDYFTAEDAALAVDVINGYYSNTFGLFAGASAENFDEAGPINASVVKYAEQFNGKKLAYMRSIDDTNTFLNDEWCAMFVSFVMKKAGVGVPKFYGCSTFWANYKDKPGFYDIVASNHQSYITKSSSHRVANWNEIKPGDILLFRWPDAKSHVARNHTGICKSVQKNAYGDVISITTIEGNTGTGGYSNTKVSIKTYSGTNRSSYSSLTNIVSFVDIQAVKNRGGW